MKNLGKSSFLNVGAGLLGFMMIVGVGSLVMMHHGGAAVKAPMAVYAPAGGAPAVPAAFRTAPASSPSAAPLAAAAVAGESSPLPVLPAEAARDAAPAQTPASAAGANAAAAPAAALAAAGRVDMSGSASTSAAAPAAAAAKTAQAASRKPAPPAKRLLPKDADAAVASTVHYGVSGRSELMGRAAGPVYNFSGGAAQQGSQVAADNATASGALRQVDAAEKQIDGSNIPDDQKAQLHQQLDQVRGAAAAPAPR